MTLLPEMAGSWGLHLISMTSSSGNLSPGNIGNLIVRHIHNSWSWSFCCWQWVTPQADILDKSTAKIPSTLVRVIRHSVGSKLLPATLSKTGALTKLVGKRKKAVNVSFVAVFMQWMSARRRRRKVKISMNCDHHWWHDCHSLMIKRGGAPMMVCNFKGWRPSKFSDFFLLLLLDFIKASLLNLKIYTKRTYTIWYQIQFV